MSVRDLLPWRRVLLPPEPVPVVLPEGFTDGWPDPHGPDPVVFGTVPRVKGETC